MEALIETLERELLTPETRASRERLAELLSDDFLEYGSSGKIYTKADILQRLPETAAATHYTMHDFSAQELAVGLIQTRFTSEHADGITKTISHRISLWKKERGSWRMCFHLGIPTQQEALRVFSRY